MLLTGFFYTSEKKVSLNQQKDNFWLKYQSLFFGLKQKIFKINLLCLYMKEYFFTNRQNFVLQNEDLHRMTLTKSTSLRKKKKPNSYFWRIFFGKKSAP